MNGGAGSDHMYGGSGDDNMDMDVEARAGQISSWWDGSDTLR
jgi:hypothetical protein